MRILSYLGVMTVGIIIGWMIFNNNGEDQSQKNSTNEIDEEHVHEEGIIWTCSMHPQIKQENPGQCPICGMDLIPLKDESGKDDSGDQFTVKLSDAAMRIADVSVTRVEKKSPYKDVYLSGKVMADERRVSELTARFPGRIEKLSINFTGQKVRKGQVLAKIYSPELITAQKELFEALKLKDSNPRYYTASRNKLKLWDLTEEQIENIEKTGDVIFYFDILSPLTGTVTIRHVTLGDYVKEGNPLFEVTDLGYVWVIFDAYESDLPWIKLQYIINFKIKSIPGKQFTGSVTFIDPVINPRSRVAGVRVEINNPGGTLKPEMLASGILKTMLSENEESLVIPKSSVLWTGKKAVVYVKTNDQNNLFQYREISLGVDAGKYYVIESGLIEGELVASNGVFKIDASAQLRGEKSMMNPGGGKVTMTHDHGITGSESEVNMEVVDHSLHGMESMDKTTMEVDPDFQRQLTDVYDEYLIIKNVFVESDPERAAKQASEIQKVLDKTDMNLLKGEAHMAWMQYLEMLKKSLDGIQGTTDLENQRKFFVNLSDALYKSINTFGLDTEKPVYYQYCPMAIDNQGAYWLSELEAIANPYFGDMMLRCGETRETIEFK
ncbi:efflux RND transporter periplasmic adaptor subunit [Bacteroidota bacterium]